jgi:hypothetical protein
VDSNERTERSHGWLWPAAAGVLAWRVLAVWFPHPADSDPELIRWLAALMGLWFLAWGLWAFREARDFPSLLFAGYGLAAGIHWGGPLGVGPAPVEYLLLALYVVLSTVLNQSLFLHLALAFPPAYTGSRRRATLVAVYLPVLLAVFLLAVLAVRPSNLQVVRAFYLFFPVGVLYSLVGGGFWIHRLVTSEPAVRRSRRLPMVVAALALGWLPHAVVSTGVGLAPQLAGLFDLPFALIPPALAWSLARPR